MKRERSGKKSDRIIVEAARADRVFFEEQQLAKITAFGFKAARIVTDRVKDRLESRGSWEDVVQSIYCASIDFYRNHAPKNFRPESNLRHRQAIFRFMGRQLYAVLRSHLSDYKRKYHEKFMRHEALNNVHEIDATGKPFVRERDLVNSDLSNDY